MLHNLSVSTRSFGLVIVTISNSYYVLVGHLTVHIPAARQITDSKRHEISIKRTCQTKLVNGILLLM